MNGRELEITRKLLARANPPPVLYRYRPANNWTLAEISKHEIFAAPPEDLNDPFEYSAPVRIDISQTRERFIEYAVATENISRQAAAEEFDSSPSDYILKRIGSGMGQMRKQSGVICMSAVGTSIRMWSYYASSHRGICLGFRTDAHPFMVAMKVLYQNPSGPLELMGALNDDPSELAGHISLRKAAEWEFEQEYRIPVGPIGDRPRALPFDPAALVEVRLGARMDDAFRSKLMEAIDQLEHPPKVIQMRCDYDKCVLVEVLLSR